jgi:transposase
VTRAQLTDSEWEFIEPFLPVGRFGPYPERLREQFEGVIWRFRTGSQWREMPERFGAWQTVYNRFMRWRDAGVFEALLEEAIAEAARRDEIDMSLVSVDSTTTRAHHDAAGMRVSEQTLAALEEAASQKGERPGNKAGRTAIRSVPNADASA